MYMIARSSISAFLLLLLPVVVSAVVPAAGTLTTASGPLTYSSGPFLIPNPTPIPEVDIGLHCNNPAIVCDDYSLTVSLPNGYTTTYPQALRRRVGEVDHGNMLLRGSRSELEGCQRREQRDCGEQTLIE